MSDGIYLSDRVKEMGCGYTIDASSKDSIKVFVASLNFDEVWALSEHISHIDTKLIVNDQGHLNNYIKYHINENNE